MISDTAVYGWATEERLDQASQRDGQLGPKLGPTRSVRDHIAVSPAAGDLESQLRSARHNGSADLGVKGSRVQISAARQGDFLHLLGIPPENRQGSTGPIKGPEYNCRIQRGDRVNATGMRRPSGLAMRGSLDVRLLAKCQASAEWALCLLVSAEGDAPRERFIAFRLGPAQRELRLLGRGSGQRGRRRRELRSHRPRLMRDYRTRCSRGARRSRLPAARP